MTTEQKEITCPAGEACESPYCLVHAPPATLTSLADDEDEPDTSQQTPEAKRDLFARPWDQAQRLAGEQIAALAKLCGLEMTGTVVADVHDYVEALHTMVRDQRARIAELEKALAPELKKEG